MLLCLVLMSHQVLTSAQVQCVFLQPPEATLSCVNSQCFGCMWLLEGVMKRARQNIPISWMGEGEGFMKMLLGWESK